MKMRHYNKTELPFSRRDAILYSNVTARARPQDWNPRWTGMAA